MHRYRTVILYTQGFFLPVKIIPGFFADRTAEVQVQWYLNIRNGSHFEQNKKCPHVNQEGKSASALSPCFYISKPFVFIEWFL